MTLYRGRSPGYSIRVIHTESEVVVAGGISWRKEQKKTTG
jgi:hypothetical protein